MRIIPSLEALRILKSKTLTSFIRKSSPWLFDDDYDAESMGYTFVLSGDDKILMQKICIVPHIPFEESEYRESMTIDLSVFSEWEYANRDEMTGYYQAVAVVGSVYGANIFMSEDFVSSIPGLKTRLHLLMESGHVE